jgi:hypothetical protein
VTNKERAAALAALIGKWRSPSVNYKGDNSTDISYDAMRLQCAAELEAALSAQESEPQVSMGAEPLESKPREQDSVVPTARDSAPTSLPHAIAVIMGQTWIPLPYRQAIVDALNEPVCTCGADRTGPSAEEHREDCPAGESESKEGRE